MEPWVTVHSGVCVPGRHWDFMMLDARCGTAFKGGSRCSKKCIPIGDRSSNIEYAIVHAYKDPTERKADQGENCDDDYEHPPAYTLSFGFIRALYSFMPILEWKQKATSCEVAQ